MHGTGAATGHEHEISRVQSLGDGHFAHEIGGFRHRDLADAARRLDGVKLERLGDALLDSLFGRIRVQDHGAVQQGRQDAEDHVGVGKRRRASAARVADGPGIGAGAFGTDSERAGEIERRDTAAASADLGDVHHRHQQGPTTARPLGGTQQFEVADRARLAVLDDAGFGGRAAHVKGDQIAQSQGLAQAAGADNATGGSRLDDLDGALGRFFPGHDAAVRLHQKQISADLHLLESLPHRLQIAGDDRHGVGIDHGRAKTFVLADARRQHRRQGDRDPWPALAQ